MLRFISVFTLVFSVFSCSQDPVDRTREIYDARMNPDEETLGLVEDRLGDPDTRVRTAALNAWVALNPDEAIPALQTALKDQEPVVRNVAAKLAGDMAATELLPQLERLVLTDPSGWVRKRSLESIFMFPTEPDPEVVLTALEDPDSNVRIAAAKGLSRVKEGINNPKLVELLSVEPDWKARVQVVRALATRQGEEAKAGLELALQDENEYVRAAALRGLEGWVNSPIPGLPARIGEPLANPLSQPAETKKEEPVTVESEENSEPESAQETDGRSL